MTFSCTCGKEVTGKDWSLQTLNEIEWEHRQLPEVSFMQCAKNVLTGNRSNWSPADEGYPWGTTQ